MSNRSVTPNRNLAILGHALERLDSAARSVDAEQYRTVVERVAAQLTAAPHDESFDEVLETYPSVAELYENLNYQHAGLCRSPLDAALAAESAARLAIERARKALNGPATSTPL